MADTTKLSPMFGDKPSAAMAPAVLPSATNVAAETAKIDANSAREATAAASGSDNPDGKLGARQASGPSTQEMGVTTSRSSNSNTQTSGGDETGDHVIQGDTIAATASEVKSIAERGKKEIEQQKAAAKAATASAGDKAKQAQKFGEEGRYKITSGPSGSFDLSVNGYIRKMKVGGVFDLMANDVDILAEARFKLERQG